MTEPLEENRRGNDLSQSARINRRAGRAQKRTGNWSGNFSPNRDIGIRPSDRAKIQDADGHRCRRSERIRDAVGELNGSGRTLVITPHPGEIVATDGLDHRRDSSQPYRSRTQICSRGRADRRFERPSHVNSVAERRRLGKPPQASGNGNRRYRRHTHRDGSRPDRATSAARIRGNCPSRLPAWASRRLSLRKLGRKFPGRHRLNPLPSRKLSPMQEKPPTKKFFFKPEGSTLRRWPHISVGM